MGNTLSFKPSVPSSWKSFEVEYKYYDSLYKIKINISTQDSIVLDGEVINKNYITLRKDKRIHSVVINIRRKK